MGRLPKVIAIVGTNASGKSSLGVELAQRYQGEILSADSRQVYRGLNLGSGKITQEEMHGVAHHMIDICNPGDFFSMADFQRLSYQLIDRILSRGNTPFIVGGTGLYIDAVLDGYLLSDKAPDLAYREYLEKFLYDGSFEEFCAATAMENTVMADEALHTLIGTSANLSLDLLHHVANEAVLQLKGNDSPENIQKVVDMVTEAYSEACMAVREYLEKEAED